MYQAFYNIYILAIKWLLRKRLQWNGSGQYITQIIKIIIGTWKICTHFNYMYLFNKKRLLILRYTQFMYVFPKIVLDCTALRCSEYFLKFKYVSLLVSHDDITEKWNLPCIFAIHSTNYFYFSIYVYIYTSNCIYNGRCAIVCLMWQIYCLSNFKVDEVCWLSCIHP